MDKSIELICVPTFGLKQYCIGARLRYCASDVAIESWVHRETCVYMCVLVMHSC